MDLFNPENGDWVQHITWMFSQPEFYPPLIIIGLIAMAVLIATFRFIFAKQFLALSVLWLVVIVAGAGLVSFFKTSQQNFEEAGLEQVIELSHDADDAEESPTVQ